MKRRIMTLGIALILVCAMCTTLLVGCNDGNKPAPNTAKGKATTYVALDINPSVELLLDENNVVVSANGLNEDAKVLLYGEDGIVGLDVKAASEKIGALSAECNFVNKDNKAVNITVGGKTAGDSKLQADISAGLNKGTGLELKVEVGANFSLEREIEAFKKQYPNNEDIQNIDIAKYRVLKELAEADPTLNIEVAVKLDLGDLIEKVDDAREAAIEAGLDMLPEAEKAALDAAEDLYEAVVERMETVQYYKIYLADADKTVHIPTTAEIEATKNHLAYIVYKNLDITFDAIEDKLDALEEEANETLAEADVDAILKNLVDNNIITEEEAKTEKAKLTKDNVVTLDEIEAYLDIKLKNAKEDVVKEAEKALDTTLDSIEDRLEAAVKDVPQSIKDDIKKLAEDMVIEIEKELGVDLSEASKNTVTTIVNTFINVNLKDVTVEALEDIDETIETKTEEYEKAVKDSMTAEQLKRVEDAKAAIKTDSKVAEAYEAYKAKVAEIKASAEAALKQAKADRKANK